MNRKQFLQCGSLLAAAPLVPALASTAAKAGYSSRIVPPNLEKGDLIGITSPAGYITREELQPAIEEMQSWGFKLRLGDTIGKRDFTFGGTDAERLADLQKMLDDKDLKAIMCARGGYGALRIVDGLNWDSFKQYPKWIIGFSDITVLHAHLNRQFNGASIHSKMCNSFPVDMRIADETQIATIQSIRDALMGRQMNYTCPAHPLNKKGEAAGVLVGGNLKTLESLAGSDSDLNTDGKILFVEDTGEYKYSIDRMFWNLKRSGKLNKLQALIVGGFKLKPDDAGSEFGKELTDIVLEKVKEFNYPVCFNFPVGHQRDNFALKCGVRHELIVGETETRLTEVL